VTKSGPDQRDQMCRRYDRTCSGRPSISCSTSSVWCRHWYQNSRWLAAESERDPIPRQWWAEHHGAHDLWLSPRQLVRHPAADVVPAEHDLAQLELVDECEETSHLPGGAVAVEGGLRLVRLAETTQVGNHDPCRVGQQGYHVAEVAAMAGPPVEQDNSRTLPVIIEGKPEAVDG